MSNPSGYFPECRGDGSPTCDCSLCMHSRLLRDYDRAVDRLLASIDDSIATYAVKVNVEKVRVFRGRLGLT